MTAVLTERVLRLAAFLDERNGYALAAITENVPGYEIEPERRTGRTESLIHFPRPGDDMIPRPTYQQEPIWLRDGIWASGHIEPWDLLRICAWKSAKGLAPLSLNSEEVILAATTNACTALEPLHDHDVLIDETDWSDWETRVKAAIGTEDRTGLLALQGVGYPIATAILCILNPRAFPVLDKLAIRDLYGADARSMSYYAHGARYCRYTRDLIAHRRSDVHSRTIHSIDQALMRRAMELVSA